MGTGEGEDEGAILLVGSVVVGKSLFLFFSVKGCFLQKKKKKKMVALSSYPEKGLSLQSLHCSYTHCNSIVVE